MSWSKQRLRQATSVAIKSFRLIKAPHKTLWVENSVDPQAKEGLLGEEPWNRRKDIAILPIRFSSDLFQGCIF